MTHKRCRDGLPHDLEQTLTELILNAPADVPKVRLLRALDLSIASVLLLITVPLLLILWIAVRLTSKGPAIFAQDRVGRGDREFTLFKLRSMVQGASTQGPYWTADGDSRITALGWLLRKTSVDELAQLWNVLRGDMSLVGPRPIVPEQRKTYSPESLALRNRVRPGITGLAQVRGRSALLKNETLYFDLVYANHPSVRCYLWVLAETVVTVLRGRGTN